MTDERFVQIKEMIESSQHNGWAAELLAALEAERAKVARYEAIEAAGGIAQMSGTENARRWHAERAAIDGDA